MGAGGEIGVAMRAELRRPGLSGGRGGRLLDGTGTGARATGALAIAGGFATAATGFASGLGAAFAGVFGSTPDFAGAAVLAFTGGAGGGFFNVTFGSGLAAAFAGLTSLSGNGFLAVGFAAAGLALAALRAGALIGVGVFFDTPATGLADVFSAAFGNVLAGAFFGAAALADTIFLAVLAAAEVLAGVFAAVFAAVFATGRAGAFDFLTGAFTISLLWEVALSPRSSTFPARSRLRTLALPGSSRSADGLSGCFAGRSFHQNP
jgi:hypothetical protein